MREVNHYNNDYDVEFFNATEYTAFGVQNAPPDMLRLSTTNLLAAHK